MPEARELTAVLQDAMRKQLRRWARLSFAAAGLSFVFLFLLVSSPPPQLPLYQVASAYFLFGFLGTLFVAFPFIYKKNLRRRGAFYNALTPRVNDFVFPRWLGFPAAIMDNGVILQAYHTGGREPPKEGLLAMGFSRSDGSLMVPSAEEWRQWMHERPDRRRLGTVSAKHGPPSLWEMLESLCRRIGCHTYGAHVWGRRDTDRQVLGEPEIHVLINFPDDKWYAKAAVVCSLVDEIGAFVASAARADFGTLPLAPA